MTYAEALTAIAEHIGDDAVKAKEVAKALRTTVPVLGQELLNAGAALQKKESQKDLDAATKRATDAEAGKAAVDAELDEVKKKTPDLATVEAGWKERIAKQKKDHETELSARDQKLADAFAGRVKESLITRLVAKGVDGDYAREVAAVKYRDRIDAKPDGSVRVLQVGGTLPYDAADEEGAIEALAKDVLKTVPAKLVTSPADSGGGSGGGGGGGGGRQTEAQLREEKQHEYQRL